jgi:hypothetical protein
MVVEIDPDAGCCRVRTSMLGLACFCCDRFVARPLSLDPLLLFVKVACCTPWCFFPCYSRESKAECQFWCWRRFKKGRNM